jgi:hypothetical protein
MHVSPLPNVMPPSVAGWSVEGPMSRAIPCTGANLPGDGDAFGARMFAVAQ